MSVYQYSPPIQSKIQSTDMQDHLCDLLSQDLDFHNQKHKHRSHDLHAFPAKFPPQLPQKFILSLTKPGDRVLDPMMGSGTTIVEAFLTKRQAIGFDIDPLALRLAQIKVTPLDADHVLEQGDLLLSCANMNWFQPLNRWAMKPLPICLI